MIRELKIIIKRTYVIIKDYKEDSNWEKFRSHMSVWDVNNRTRTKYVTWRAYKEDGDDLIIHRGIKYDEFIKYFPNHKIEYDDSYTPYKLIRGINCNTKPRDELQINTIQFLKNTTSSQKFICLKPGSGKTYCCIKYISDTKLIPIIFCDNDKTLLQWRESFIKFTNITNEDIYQFSGSPTVDKILNENNSNYKVYLASHRTLQSYCKNDISKVDELFSKLGIGIKVFDEAHVEWMNIFNIDVNSNIYETIYLTATPGRSKQSEKEVYNRMFGSIDMYGYEESREKQHILYIDASWNSKPLEYTISYMTNSKGFDSNRYNDYLLKNETFFEILLKMTSSLFTKNDKLGQIAIVVNCNNMIEEIYKRMSTDKRFDGKSIGRYCMLVNKSERMNELEKDIILTTIKGFNKAVDVPNLEILINTVNISSLIMIEQLSGRLRFKEGVNKYFIQITDEGFPQFIFNRSARDRIMKKIAAKSTSCQLKL